MGAEEGLSGRAVVPSGEVAGSMFVGLIRAFRNIRLISGEHAARLVEGVESNTWYPMASFFRLLDDVCDRDYDVDFGPILFHAGMAVAQDWYVNGPGRAQAPGVAEFLRLQGESGGYTAVHRGERSQIGWMDLVELDEDAGRAVVVCTTPYPKEFERGVLFGGTLFAGDTDYAHVDSVEEPFNRHLTRKTLTIRFRRRPPEKTRRELDALLAGMEPGKRIAPTKDVAEALAWRLKGLEELHRSEALFHEQSVLLLEKASREIWELTRKLTRLANHDELTGLLNRRAVLARAEELLELSDRHGWPVAFIMIDIDHFKSINDLWGHALGDEALGVVAEVMRRRLRDSDLLGRIGGEEFLVVLPEVGVDGARIVAEDLRSAIEQHVLTSAGLRIPLTISLGIAVGFGHRAGDVGIYIRQADQALYSSKQNGRNRASCFLH